MSEWTSVIAVYWILWAIEGLRLARTRTFAIVGGTRPAAGRARFDRWILPAMLPTSWRLTSADVPLALSPLGVSNQPIGSAGRPAESPSRIEAWAWNEIRAARSGRGWLWINGQRFCPDTGHVTAAQLLELAKLAPAAREGRIRALLRRWFRPAHLRRRVRVLVGRTAAAAACNGAALIATALLSMYVIADVPSRVGEERAAAIAALLPYVVTGVLALHVAAIVLALRARRRLQRVLRGFCPPGLLSAAMLPPQALRLRALLGERFFPATHPWAAIAALAHRRAREEAAFQALADLRWPMPSVADSPLAPPIAAWFAAALEPEFARIAATAGLSAEKLLQPPPPDSPASCCYCPRCRAQFLSGVERCPNGIALRPLVPAAADPPD